MSGNEKLTRVQVIEIAQNAAKVAQGTHPDAPVEIAPIGYAMQRLAYGALRQMDEQEKEERRKR